MVAQPAALMRSRAGRKLQPQDLVAHLTKQAALPRSAADATPGAAPPSAASHPLSPQWLDWLSDGSAASVNRLPDLEALIHCGGTGDGGASRAEEHDPAAAEPTGGSAVPAAARVQSGAAARRLLKVIQLNCFGEPYGDLAACTARGEALCSHVGVWPAFAMLNSSCLPNAAGMVLGGRMVVRATRAIAAGDEACITYLGPFVSSPLEERQSRLRQSFGFQCTCDRCWVESEHQDAAAASMQATYTRLVSTLAPAVAAAVEAEEVAAVRRLQRQLLSVAAGVQSDLAGVEDPYEHACLHSGTYKCHELLSMCADALAVGGAVPSAAGGKAGGTDDQLPVRLRLLGLFAAGSYGHAALAAEHLSRTRGAGGGGDGRDSGDGGDWKTQRAVDWCLAAHTARYGAVSTDTLARLVDGHDSNALLDGLVARDAARSPPAAPATRGR